jgi:hypothetical protein
MTNEGWVRAHDKYQIEIKLGYDLRPHHRRDNYRVDTYFFLPENLDVNESTYTKDRFYRDLILYIRFRTPEFTLTTLTDPGSERSPLSRVVRGLENGLAAPTPKIIAGLDYEMRLLGCVVKNTLRAQTRAIAKLLPPIAAPQMVAQASALLDEYLVESQRLIQRYRELRARVADPGLPAGLSAVYHYTDEYISLLIEDRSQDLLSLLQQRGDPRHAGHIQSLIDLIGAEINHRKLVQLPSLVEASGDNETFVFRLSVLKKYMASALRLSVETRDERGGLEHMVLALGAGVAMLFATTIAFYYQRVFGTLSLGFLWILVVSYMFKDRLKALTQSWLHGWLSKRLYDQTTRLRDPIDQKTIGTCREAVSFAREKSVDPIVLKLRDRDHITEIENTWRAEKVIHYTRDIALYSERFLKTHSRKGGITDIVRFNLRNFLVKMDEPEVTLRRLSKGKVDQVRGTRVYHVNIVLRFASPEETRYERIRLVLNRDGIKRVETVSSERTEGRAPGYSSPLILP